MIPPGSCRWPLISIAPAMYMYTVLYIDLNKGVPLNAKKAVNVNVSGPHRLCAQCSLEAFYGLVALLFLLLLQSQQSLSLWVTSTFNLRHKIR